VIESIFQLGVLDEIKFHTWVLDRRSTTWRSSFRRWLAKSAIYRNRRAK